MNTTPNQKSQTDIIPSKKWIYLFGILALISGYLCLDLSMDNRFQQMLNPSNEEASQYEDFIATFGNDEFIIIGISGKPILEVSALDVMLEVLEALEALPLVKSVNGIPTVYRDHFGAEDPEAFFNEITSTPFYEGLFINPDATIAGLLLDPQPLENPEDHQTLVEGIERAISPLQESGFRVDIVGGPVFNVKLNKLSMSESFRIFPIAATLSLIALFILLRSTRAVLTVLICGALSLLYTISLVRLAGLSLNVVTSMLPIILWVLSIANVIHLVCRYQYYRREISDARTALNRALHDVRRACTLSSITTALGFVSLTLADIAPVAQLGYLMSAGLMISLAVNLLLGSNILLLLNVPASRGKYNNHDSKFKALAKGALRYKLQILFIFTLLFFAGVYSLTRLHTNPDWLGFMPSDSQTHISYTYILENLTGASTIEIVINTPNGWLNDEYWEPITNLNATISDSSNVARVMSPYDFLKKVNQWDQDFDPEFYRLPDSTKHAQDLFGMLEPDERKEISRLVSDDGQQIRVTVFINSMRADRIRSVKNIADKAVESLPYPLTGHTTGLGLRLEDMQQRMVSTQIKTFSFAFLLVFLSILIGLRSVKAMLMAILPNLVPILTVFIAMNMLGITLDAATVMVISIALGIAVDDTVHLLSAIHDQRKYGDDKDSAVRNGLVKVGYGISVTTVVATIGFFTLSTSLFVPIAFFGLLSGIAMITALIADFFLVPALYSFGLFRQNGES